MFLQLTEQQMCSCVCVRVERVFSVAADYVTCLSLLVVYVSDGTCLWFVFWCIQVCYRDYKTKAKQQVPTLSPWYPKINYNYYY